MKAILHIGTHKTGTSSIQNFFTSNKERLLSQGIYYGLGKKSIRNVNYVAAHIAYGRNKEVKSFFNQILADANKDKIKCLFISAESLYGMTGFFHLLQLKRIDNYWQTEESFLSFLGDCLKDVQLEIIIYLRRQDLFLESIYNQFVKQEKGYAGSINDFYEICPEILDYEQHLKLWKKIFPRSEITIKNYEFEKTDLINRLINDHLKIEYQADLIYPKKPINTGLGPDLLAFKRILNSLDMTLSESYVAYKTMMKLSRQEKNENNDFTLISSGLRERIIKQVENGNNNISAIYLKDNERVYLESKDIYLQEKKLYPGLKISDAIEIYYKFKNIINKPRIKLEIYIRNSIRLIFVQFPFLEHLLWGFRKPFHKKRIRLEREGLV